MSLLIRKKQMTLKNISIATKLYGLAGLLIAFLLLSTAVSLIKMQQIGIEIADIAEQDIPLTNLLSNITTHQLEQAINFERALRLGGEMKSDPNAAAGYKKAVGKFESHSKIVNSSIKKAEVLAEKAKQFAHTKEAQKEFEHVESFLKNIEVQHKIYEEHVHEVFNVLLKGDVQHANKLSEKIEVEEEKIDHELQELLVELQNFTQAATLRAEHDEQDAFRLLVIIAVVALVFGGGLSIVLIRKLVGNLLGNIRSATISAELIAAGDLTKEVSSNGNDEMARLIKALDVMRNNLHDMVADMGNSSSQLAAASEELTAVSNESKHNINIQQSEVEQAATATNEMTSTIQEVAKNAASASEAAMTASESTVEGKQVVQKTVESIGDLAEDIEKASNVIHELESHSEKIGGVLDVIKNIAEQTNLLALNAAIEAARAGEQGRGFAVVADEVRTLASRTQESTTEIESMVDQLQNGARESVAVMVTSREKATKTVEQANAAGTALHSITESVSLISDMNTQIATAAEEQSSVADEINRNITSINDLGKETSTGANETSSACEELAQLAASLQNLIDRFKV